jgi:hypothetical protein
MLVPQDLEPAAFEQPIQIGGAKIGKVARNIDARPALAQQQELPAGSVGDLHDQSAFGREQLMRGAQITSRIVEVFQDMKHGDRGATSSGKGSLSKVSAHCGNAGAPPGCVGRIHRKIEAGHWAGTLYSAAFREHLQEQSTAAACVGDDPLGFGFAQGSFDELQVVAQHKPAIPLLHPIDGGRLGNVPVVEWIILRELGRRGLGVQTNQAAGRALDDLENAVGGAIEPVGGGKQFANFRVSTSDAQFFGGRVQLADSESSRSPIRFAISSRRICRPVSLRFSRSARRLRSMAGIRGNACAIPRKRASPAVNVPPIPG